MKNIKENIFDKEKNNKKIEEIKEKEKIEKDKKINPDVLDNIGNLSTEEEREIEKEDKVKDEKEIEGIRDSLGKYVNKEKTHESYESQEELEKAAELSDKEYLSSKEGVEKDKKIRKSNKLKRWVARYILQGAIYGGSTLAGLFGASDKATAQEVSPEVKDPEDLKNKKEMQAEIQEDVMDKEENYVADFSEFEGVGPDPEELTEQEKEDAKIYNRHEKEWEQDHKYYVRDGNELKSVIRHSLNHLSDNFEDVRDLRNSVSQLYDGVLSAQEIKDLYSFIENGAPDGHEGAISRKDVENLQTIYNKIASAPSDKINDNLNNILESNSAKEGGVDSMYGLATSEASNSLMLEKIAKALKLSGVEYEPIESEVNENLKEVPEKDSPEERGYTSITLEKDIDLNPDQVHAVELFTAKMDDFKFDNLTDFIKNFESSEFDKIEITGKDVGNNVEYNGEPVDFDTLDDLGTGKYDVHTGDYNFSFDYLREQDGDLKTFSNIEINYEGEQGKINVSADEVVKDINAFDKNDPSKEGFTRSVKGFKLNAFDEVQIEIDDLYKYENVNEIGTSASDVNLKIGQWSLSAESFKGTYKTPEGEFDLGNLVEDVCKGKDGARVGDLIDRFDLSSGPVVIENESGSTRLEYDGTNYFVNDYKIYKDKEGNFNFINNKGEGAVYEGGFSSYTKVNGENMSTKEFVNNLVYEGAEVMLDSPDLEVGISAMGGFIEINTGNIESEISEETLETYREDINSTSDRIANLAEDFAKKAESGDFSDLVEEGVALKTEIASEVGALIDRMAKDGNIKMEDWSVSADFKTLADNFKLIGKPDAASSVYKLDALFSALGNDLGKITIDQNFVDGYGETKNKADFVSQHIWGSKVNELKEDFLNRASSEIGAELLRQPTEKIMSIINATNNGSVEGITLSPNEIQAYYNLSKKLNPEGTNFILYANANLGERSQNQEAYVNIFDTAGKEHLNVGAEYKDYGGLGMIATKVIETGNDNTMVKALGGLNLEFTKLDDLSLGFGDGKGNNYQVLDGENFFKLTKMAGSDKSIDLMKKAIDNNWIVPVPQAEIGVDVTHDIIGSKGGKTTLEATALASSNYLNTSLNLSLRAEKDLGNLTGLPLTVGGKVDTNCMLNGARHVNAQGGVFVRWDIGKNVNRYISK